MKTTIFVPEKINVGFVSRTDTFTGQLSYIIYFDEKKVEKRKVMGELEKYFYSKSNP